MGGSHSTVVKAVKAGRSTARSSSGMASSGPPTPVSARKEAAKKEAASVRSHSVMDRELRDALHASERALRDERLIRQEVER